MNGAEQLDQGMYTLLGQVGMSVMVGAIVLSCLSSRFRQIRRIYDKWVTQHFPALRSRAILQASLYFCLAASALSFLFTIERALPHTSVRVMVTDPEPSSIGGYLLDKVTLLDDYYRWTGKPFPTKKVKYTTGFFSSEGPFNYLSCFFLFLYFGFSAWAIWLYQTRNNLLYLGWLKSAFLVLMIISSGHIVYFQFSDEAKIAIAEQGRQ